MAVKKGKWSGIVEKFPRYVGEEEGYQEKVEKEKARLLEEIPLESSSLVRAFVMIRKEKQENEKLEKKINLTVTALQQLISDQFEAEGISNVTLDSGQTVRVQHEPHAKVVDRDANRIWAIKNGYESQLALPWQTLNAITKDLLIEGNPEPDGVSSYNQAKVFLTGAGE